jgi:hypothetical protein
LDFFNGFAKPPGHFALPDRSYLESPMTITDAQFRLRCDAFFGEWVDREIRKRRLAGKSEREITDSLAELRASWPGVIVKAVETYVRG